MNATNTISDIGYVTWDTLQTAVQYGLSSAAFGIGDPFGLAIAGSTSRLASRVLYSAAYTISSFGGGTLGRCVQVDLQNQPDCSALHVLPRLCALIIAVSFISYSFGKLVVNKMNRELRGIDYLKTVSVVLLCSAAYAHISKSSSGS